MSVPNISDATAEAWENFMEENLDSLISQAKQEGISPTDGFTKYCQEKFSEYCAEKEAKYRE